MPDLEYERVAAARGLVVGVVSVDHESGPAIGIRMEPRDGEALAYVVNADGARRIARALLDLADRIDPPGDSKRGRPGEG